MDASNMNYDALVALLPEPARAWVVLGLQFIAAVLTFTTAVLPLLEKVAKATKTDRDDKALSAVQRVLSVIPRVQVPALSNPPPKPAPTATVQVTAWPDTSKLGSAPSPEIVPPAPPPPQPVAKS